MSFNSDMKDDQVGLELLLEYGEISTSMLIRAKKMTFRRAHRILDRMEDQGLIGPPNGEQPRQQKEQHI